ncbi:MAG: hypothetical protein ACO1OB_21500 [Archangium sp.]
MSDERTALEFEIEQRPDDRSRYAVLADWYQERGDARGELMALQLAAKHTPREAELIAAETVEASDVKWRWGFVESLRFERTTHREDWAELMLAPLLEHPACRFLRALELDVGPGDQALTWLATNAPKTLSTLALTCNEADLSLVRGRLEQLDTLRFAAQLLVPAVLPSVRALELPIDAMTDAGLMHVLGTQRRLRELTLTSLDVIDAPTLQAVIQLRLESLTLRASVTTIDAVKVLTGSWMKNSLNTLDVSESGLTEEAARALLDAVPGFSRLSSLVVGA